MRYGSALDYNHDRVLPSSEVRVSYFDPTTGEPLDRKPTIERKSSEIEERVRNRDAWAARDAARRGGRRPKPVIVDGVRHPSVSAAARSIGCAVLHISKKLNAGAIEHMGHSVVYEEAR